MAAALLVTLVCVPATAHDPIGRTVTWNGDISRLVQARCVGCHTAGGRGPMPLTSYEAARPWARAIREEVLTRRMPKWHAARGYGQFANDRSLTPFEIALFVAWVDGGATRGHAPRDRGEPVAQGLSPAATFDAAPHSKARSLRCGERPLPQGRLLAVRPALEEGGSAGISLRFPDGRREVIAWVRGFERKFADTYWLQTPLDVPAGTRLHVEASGRCRVTVFMN